MTYGVLAASQLFCSGGAKMMLSLPSLLAGVMDLAIRAIDIYADM